MSDIWRGDLDAIAQRSFDRYWQLKEVRLPIYGYNDLAEVVCVKGKPVFRMRLNKDDPRVEQVLEILFSIPHGLCRGSLLEDVTTVSLKEDEKDLYVLSVGEYSTIKIRKVYSWEEADKDVDKMDVWWREGEYSMLVNLIPGLLKLISNTSHESIESKPVAELKENTRRFVELSHESALKEFEEAENACGKRILKEMGLLKKEEK